MISFPNSKLPTAISQARFKCDSGGGKSTRLGRFALTQNLISGELPPVPRSSTAPGDHLRVGRWHSERKNNPPFPDRNQGHPQLQVAMKKHSGDAIRGCSMPPFGSAFESLCIQDQTLYPAEVPPSPKPTCPTRTKH